MFDPGFSLKSTTLLGAWRLLMGIKGSDSFIRDRESSQSQIKESDPFIPEDATEAVEALAGPAGMRSRRVLLDAKWWRQAGGPMIARVSERRRVPRGPTPMANPSLAAGTGWVAIVPDVGGYRMRATDEEGKVVE